MYIPALEFPPTDLSAVRSLCVARNIRHDLLSTVARFGREEWAWRAWLLITMTFVRNCWVTASRLSTAVGFTSRASATWQSWWKNSIAARAGKFLPDGLGA